MTRLSFNEWNDWIEKRASVTPVTRQTLSISMALISGLISYRVLLHGCCHLLKSMRISSANNFFDRTGLYPMTPINYIQSSIVTPFAIASSAIVASHIFLQTYSRLITESHTDILCKYPFVNEILSINGTLHYSNIHLNAFIVVGSLLSFSIFRYISVYRFEQPFSALTLFRAIAPSDVWCVGSFGTHTIGAASKLSYASKFQSETLQRYGLHNGCHHCGDRLIWKSMRWNAFRLFSKKRNRLNRIPFIGDHIPPTALVTDSISQSFLPQCERCSQRQSVSVRLKQRALIAHKFWIGTRLWHLWIPFPVFYVLMGCPQFSILQPYSEPFQNIFQ